MPEYIPPMGEVPNTLAQRQALVDICNLIGGTKSYLDGKWERPQSEAEASIIHQLFIAEDRINKVIAGLTDYDEHMGKIFLPTIRRIQNGNS